jgi:hypothetical protein
MANINTNIVYTLADIELYLQGKMDAAQMHLLEKAALTDAFLADAIEGYQTANLTSAKQQLQLITTALAPAESAEEKEYTLIDIENYLQGRLSPAERHAMEKAALKDPFLADAIEGYEEVNINKAKQQLNIVEQKLKPANSNDDAQKNYGFTEIEAYLTNHLDKQERHELEKNALQQPLLADAIEGYEQSNLASVKAQLQQIETAILGEEKQSTKVVAMNAGSSNKQWLRIAVAAMFILVAGTTIWLVGNNKPTGDKPTITAAVTTKEQPSAVVPPVASPIQEQSAQATPKQTEQKRKTNSNDLATIENTPSSKAVAAPIITLKPSQADKAALASNTKDDNQLDNKWAAAREKTKVDSIEAANRIKKSIAINNEVVVTASTHQAKKAELGANQKVNITDALKGKVAGVQVTNNINSYSGKVVDANGQGIPNASVQLKNNRNTQAGFTTDANGNFTYPTQDSFSIANVNALGYNSRNATLNRSVNNQIVLDLSSNTLAEEVVVTNFGSKRKQAVEANLGTPVGGLKSFEEYVSKKKETLKQDSTDEEEYVEGLVELEFDVDKLGKPYNISVTNANSVNSTTTNKAIQIVKEGPAWIADKKKKKAKVTIKM